MKHFLSPASRRRQHEPPPTEDRLAASLLEQLAADLLDAAQWIHVEVRDGTAHLRGRVPSGEARARAEQIAEAFGGVDRVENRLDVERW
jgi:osmotically-inducible protein OsmY